jgi:hypothetical protein
MNDVTYFVAPVEHGDGLRCRIGTGREAITGGASYAAVVVAAKVGQVMAVWKFTGQMTHEEAENLAVQVAPTRLMICASEDYGTLELSHEYTTEVEVTDVRRESSFLQKAAGEGL